MFCMRFLKPALSLFVFTLAIAVLMQNFVLLRRIRAVQRTSIQHEFVQAGTRLPPINAIGLDGRPRTLLSRRRDSQSSQPLLIITVGTQCPTCIALLERWKEVAARLRSLGDWSIVWVIVNPLDVARKYAESNNIPPNEVLTHPDYPSARFLKLSAVPQMMVVTEDGLVKKVWGGAQPWTSAEIIAASTE